MAITKRNKLSRKLAEKIKNYESLGLSRREIARRVGVNESTLRGWGKAKIDDVLKEAVAEVTNGRFDTEGKSLRSSIEPIRILTSSTNPYECRHFVIPDTQVKPGVSLEYLRCVGEYLVRRRPDVIVHLGDHGDMPSLSSYDKGKKKAEGKRILNDIEAAIEGMNVLLGPLKKLQDEQLKEYGKVLYKPRMVLTLGNHEHRIMRHVDDNPELAGFLSYDNLRYEDNGWEVHDFLKPVTINGVAYCHFMPNPFSGKPIGGAAHLVLQKVGESYTCGHKQTLDVATRFLPTTGRQQWGITAGACYDHFEDYKGYQGNHHWRGVIEKNNVCEGSYNPMFVDLEYIMKRYANGKTN